MSKRKLSKSIRLKLRKNALKGTKKWEKMSHKARIKARNKKYYSWGFRRKKPSHKTKAPCFKT